MSNLKKEAELFEQRLDQWLSEGKVSKYVVIRGDHVVGFFDSVDDAVLAGLEQYGLQPFFMDLVLPRDVTDIRPIGRAS